MRQLHSRWSLFAGAVAASVAALSFPALAATTDTEVLAAPAIHQSPTAVYLIDGYEVTYLPSELANYSSRWESSRKNEERSSSVTWVNNDTVYGSVARTPPRQAPHPGRGPRHLLQRAHGAALDHGQRAAGIPLRR